MRTTLGRAVAALIAIAVTCVAIVGGCSRSDEHKPSVASGSDSSDGETPGKPAKPPVTTQVVVGKVVGKLGERQKQALKDDMKKLVDGFFEAAYLGEFPRKSFGEAYDTFTSGARDDAKRDADLLSNAAISDRIETATGVKRRVALDVLSVKGVAQGVTARFTLDFDTAGDLEQRDRVKGFLLLDHEGGHWRVFGYNVLRSVIS